MKKLLLLMLFSPYIVLSQNNNNIKNINVNFENETLEIRYNFEYPKLVTSYYNITLKFLTLDFIILHFL